MSEKCISCGSCGMPLIKESDFAGGNTAHKLCNWCGDEHDQLKVTFTEVVAECAETFIEKQGIDKAAAQEKAAQYISSLSVWRNKK